MDDLDVFLGKEPPNTKSGVIVCADERFERFKGLPMTGNDSSNGKRRAAHQHEDSALELAARRRGL